MYGGTRIIRVRIKLLTAALLLCSYVLGLVFPFTSFMGALRSAEAAEVTIDSDVSITSSVHLKSGSNTVFINDQTGYIFFVDAGGYCAYRKTTNGGTSWGATTTVDAQLDCIQIQVWYDQWTPGISSASTSIHIATMDSGNDDIWYNRLDTNGDTLLLGSSPVSTFTGSGQGGTSLATSENFTSITRASNGTIYVVSNDGSGVNDSAVLECTVSCNLAASWTETTPLPLDVASDQNLIVPLTNGDVMLIQRDISADDIRSRIWNDSAGSWAGAWTTIDANATENTTYDHGLAAAVSSTTPGVVYIAYTANVATLGTDDQVRTARYNGTSWATSSNATSTTARGITNVAIALDAANDDVYVAYSARTTPATAGTANVFWRKATSSMMNWGTETGPVNVGAEDIYGVDLNMKSDERIYMSWYEATPDDYFGDTIADIHPGVNATTTGSQITSTVASTSNVYLGGAFVLYNTYRNKSYDVTGLTITESGTIDGSTGIANVRILYEMDTTAPYNCASESYAGSENQFGSTDTNGFSGANGVSSFIGTTVSLSTTTALCGYVVFDVSDAAVSSSTIDISIADLSTDVTVSGSSAGPAGTVALPGTTLVYNDTPTQAHYHWRNDDGTEITATSRTSGNEDTALTALPQGSPARLRLEVSNEGSTSTGPIQYRLEYGSTTGSCAETSVWVNVGDAGGDFDMYDSSNLTNAADTTNIAVASGGVTDENTTFLSTNGGVRDTSSQTGSINLSPTQFVELEYSLVASTSAAEGTTYCFRVTNAGNPLTTYSQLARASIAADVLVTASGTQVVSTSLPATDFYVGGQFVAVDNTGSRNVTSVTIKENGTVDGQNDLDNIRLRYDLDTTAPYDCSSESYSGSESQFGSIDTDGFSGPNGTSTFTGSVSISTTQSLCLYTVLDTTATAQNGETVDISMESPSQNFIVSAGSVSPSITRDMNGSTTLNGPILTQTHYHWRNDNGTEADATSMTGGSEDSAVTNVAQTTPVRLRVQVSNEGAISAPSQTFRVEYGAKITTCSAVSSWIDVGAAGGAWDMFNSSNLTDGTDTTDIAVSQGGVTNENTTFLTPNGGVKDTSSTMGGLTLTATQFVEAEFSMQQTTQAGLDITYCFRLTNGGSALDVYSTYPELTTSPERDFEVQRGTVQISGTSTTLIAGTHYTAPTASTSAFIRITNTSYTGAGTNVGGGTQNTDDVTAYIVNPSNIMTSVTIARPAAAINSTRVSWEIIEFIGTPGSDNEMIVRSQSAVTYGTANLFATGTTVSTLNDDSDAVVFITGQLNPDTGTANYNSGQSISTWHATSNVPVFERGVTGSDASIVSYAVVEFTGQNWQIQRSEHTYTSAGTTETEPITAVGSLSRTFIHAQKLNGNFATGTDEYGHEVWLSSVGFVSYFLESGASVPSDQRSVAWIIENVQTSSGAMDVTRPPQGSSNGGAEPLVLSASITKTLSDITNASIFGTSRSAGTGLLYPRPIAGLTIASTTHYEVWRSDTGANLTYRVEIVEWPTAGLAVRQNYYRFYVDNNALDPTDPWPAGGTDLGENTVLSAADEPLGEGERLRIRMSLTAVNATLPTSTKAFKLQYAPLTTTCSAISEGTWATLGNSASSTVWRGFNATGTIDGTVLSGNPPTAGALNLSVSQQSTDVAGTLEEENDSAANPYSVPEGNDIEYDWFVEQNGATAETFYCFRMIESDGTPLAAYLQYPQARTASFTPKTQNWRWFTDETQLTPTSSLAAINAAPVNITNDDTLVLRITVKETKNIARNDVRFKLQYSEYADFSTSTDVVATSTCIATSTWCYANAAGIDNAVLASTTLNDVDSCVLGVGNGCGTYNEMPTYKTGFRHEHGAATEYSFSIKPAYPRVNTVYYFRLFDLVQNIPVAANNGESYPSLATEGASLTFSTQSVPAFTVTEGITTDIAATATSVPFGRLTIGNEYEAAQRFSVTTNSPEGYQLYMVTSANLSSASGDIFTPLTGSNSLPTGWNTGCESEATSCFGYHTGDDTLSEGSTRFAANDTYARFSTTTLDEVLYTGGPVTNEVVDVVYKIRANSLQPAGQYTTNIRYIAVPVF